MDTKATHQSADQRQEEMSSVVSGVRGALKSLDPHVRTACAFVQTRHGLVGLKRGRGRGGRDNRGSA